MEMLANLCILKKGSIEDTLCGKKDIGACSIEHYNKMISSHPDFTFCPHCTSQIYKQYEIDKPQPCVYANSRYTTATNSPRRHIDNGSGKPLCQTSAKASISFTSSIDIPDCKRCIKIANKGEGLK